MSIDPQKNIYRLGDFIPKNEGNKIHTPDSTQKSQRLPLSSLAVRVINDKKSPPTASIKSAVRLNPTAPQVGKVMKLAAIYLQEPNENTVDADLSVFHQYPMSMSDRPVLRWRNS